MPAHITINYSFLPGMNPCEDVHHELRELFAKARAFQFTLSRLARIPDVLYLAPEPDTPFKQLINLVAAYFPESLPYGGAFDEIIPHLTVAQTKGVAFCVLTVTFLVAIGLIVNTMPNVARFEEL